MAIDIVMPNLGFDTQEGRLVEWLKQVGDTIRQGEAIAVVESDKSDVELESIASGVLLEQLFPADQVVQVGTVIARVGAAGERPTQTAAAPAAPAESKPARPETRISPIARRIAQENNIDLSAVQGTGQSGRITRADVVAHSSRTPANGSLLALPKVRKAARDLGIDLHEVVATGKAGQVTMADLEAYQAQLRATPEPAPVQTAAPVAPATPTPEPVAIEGGVEVPLSRSRQVAAQRLTRSMQEAPHFYVNSEFDVEDALKKLATLNSPQRIRINDLLQYLTVQSLLHVPQLNATYDGETLLQYAQVNLSIAVSRGDDLVTPVIPGAERFSLVGLAAESRERIQRAQDNRLKPADMQNGTFTMSNLGVIKQVDQFTAVINPPQVAILAVGTVKQRPVVLNGGLHIRHTVRLTLSGDHRVVDGMVLGRFLAAFQTELDQFSQ